MNENSQVNRPAGGAGPVAIGFVLGALVGAAVALLLAPTTGKETRRRIVDAGERLGNAARSNLGQARDTANDLKQDVKSALRAGREAFELGQKSHEASTASD